MTSSSALIRKFMSIYCALLCFHCSRIDTSNRTTEDPQDGDTSTTELLSNTPRQANGAVPQSGSPRSASVPTTLGSIDSLWALAGRSDLSQGIKEMRLQFLYESPNTSAQDSGLFHYDFIYSYKGGAGLQAQVSWDEQRRSYVEYRKSPKDINSVLSSEIKFFQDLVNTPGMLLAAPNSSACETAWGNYANDNFSYFSGKTAAIASQDSVILYLNITLQGSQEQVTYRFASSPLSECGSVPVNIFKSNLRGKADARRSSYYSILLNK